MERAQPITMHLEEGEALDVTPGVYLSVIRELPWLGESKAGREKVVFPVRLTEPPFEEVEGEVHSGIRVAARILGRLGVSVQVQGRAITFDPVECLDKPCRTKWEAGQRGFVRCTDILPVEEEEIPF